MHLRMLGENELENRRQERTGTICLAGTKCLLLLSQIFGTVTCPCLTGWIPSSSFFVLYMRTFLCGWIYLLLHVNILRPKEWQGHDIRLQHSSTTGAGGCLQVETRHISTLVLANRVFSCFSSNCAMLGTGWTWYLVGGTGAWLCLAASSPREPLSLRARRVNLFLVC